MKPYVSFVPMSHSLCQLRLASHILPLHCLSPVSPPLKLPFQVFFVPQPVWHLRASVCRSWRKKKPFPGPAPWLLSIPTSLTKKVPTEAFDFFLSSVCGGKARPADYFCFDFQLKRRRSRSWWGGVQSWSLSENIWNREWSSSATP